jgi:hypothetical protein
VQRAVDASSLRRVAADAKLSPAGLRNFLDDAEPYTGTLMTPVMADRLPLCRVEQPRAGGVDMIRNPGESGGRTSSVEKQMSRRHVEPRRNREQQSKPSSAVPLAVAVLRASA